MYCLIFAVFAKFGFGVFYCATETCLQWALHR